MRFWIWLTVLMSSSTLAQAAELRGIEVRRGTDGLEPVRLRLENRTGRTLDCQAQIAHWYSAPIAEIAAGKIVERILWHDPVSGTVSVLNDGQENLPVEALWCGYAGKAWETRAPVVLDHARSETPLELTCRAGPDRVICE